MTAPTIPTAPPASSRVRALRGYQIEAADAVIDGWTRGRLGPAVVLPTGSGKSTVIAELARRELATGGRVLMLAHRNELIEQMADAVLAVNPYGPTPELIGGPHHGSHEAQIISATVQSLQRSESRERLGHRDLLIIDEAHHAVASTYLKIIEHFGTTRRAGFTATMTRMQPTKDEPSLRSVWDEVVYERDIRWAIDNGFLLPPYGLTVTLPELDVDNIHAGDGEITDDEASDAMMVEATLNATVAAVVDRTSGLSTIVFGSSITHCRAVTERLVRAGVTAEVVVGTTTSRDRAGIYHRFQSGQTRVLVTVDVLTEGADFPHCEAVVLARPTRSQPRLVQCVGRGLRPHTFHDGRVKERALVVDLVRAGTLGLIVETKLDRLPTTKTSTATICEMCCVQPCTCTGGISVSEPGPPCRCRCNTTSGICRCGCKCDTHRIEPLVDFDPITGERSVHPVLRGDAPWSVRTKTIRWSRHERGLVRPIYRSNGSKGILLLSDIRGLDGVAPGMGWAFGFRDTDIHQTFWIGTDGEWHQPGSNNFLQGMSLPQADDTAQKLFSGHMKDITRSAPSESQMKFAARLKITAADELDRRDLSDLIALAQADELLPLFAQTTNTGTAA